MGLLESKIVLITGGTSGIGRASALLFANEGAKVALTGPRAAEGETVVAEIATTGGEAMFVHADLADVDGIPAMVDRIVVRYGRLDCAFNNAEISDGGPLNTSGAERRQPIGRSNAVPHLTESQQRTLIRSL
jgi:NAD(P)-dependent dehydrogenase (short-subunit alcohol dehydrogenase family)